jgi:lysophospholipase L1-like esterase
MNGPVRVLLVCLALAVAAAIYLAGYSRLVPLPRLPAYADRSSTAIYQSRLDYFRKADTRADLVFVGDSLTEFGEWSELFPGTTTANRGIGGDNTRALAERLDALGDISQSTVMLMIGINDFLALGATPEEVAARYAAILRDLTARARHVVVQSTLPVTAPENTAVNADTAQLNAAIRELCNEKCSYLDLSTLRMPDGSLHPDTTIDGVHLNGTGYLAWATALRDHLAALPGG